MSKLLVVFGATGQQGGSIIDYVLNDGELSKQYHLCALTRDPSSSSAQTLKSKGVDVVKADNDDEASLKEALKGAHTVFVTTNTIYDKSKQIDEYNQGKRIADISVAAGASYLIWSTSTHVDQLSNGKFNQVIHFNVKADVEDYIRTLPIKSAFYGPGAFMQNYNTMAGPKPLGDGTYGLFNVLKPESTLPLVDITDTGKCVGAVLAEPDKFNGKTLSAATRMYSQNEIVEIMSRVTGKTIKYVQIPVEKFAQFMPPNFREPLVEMHQFCDEFGYYGEGTREEVEETAKTARGKLTELEEYLRREPLKLE
ncbi:hypothetical protein LTS18_004376 [Coniosporium uncinatum]|uniref:Uncharacterized protein n=1 Tax=Coniosporium uncinatum TaxID=93489 RepID=A0ACC3DSU4_9PEZI|nr:hypothetical protein LTS18_004376 [Coniosporium uncinatum]